MLSRSQAVQVWLATEDRFARRVRKAVARPQRQEIADALRDFANGITAIDMNRALALRDVADIVAQAEGTS